jgi:AAA15 family ATPase/GTPase
MLNSLVIKNFRMLEDFTVSKLGRVNLIVGKNNSGKSTVLEALRIYAGNANLQLLKDIGESHDENFLFNDEEQHRYGKFSYYADLFTDRELPEDDATKILIGESAISEQSLCIQNVFLEERIIALSPNDRQNNLETGLAKVESEIIRKSDIQSLSIPPKQAFRLTRNNKSFYLRFDIWTSYPIVTFANTPYGFIPTEFISMDELAREWDQIARTEHEKIVNDALAIIEPKFKDLIFVENERSSSAKSRRIPKIKLADSSRPVPLRSLGDGMIRVLQLALKLVSAKGGFLLIDEFENGLHYTTQEKIWALLFEMAEKLDIQVFATTHSWDCIESFTKVAIENETTEGILFRMGKSARTSNRGQIIATVFDKDDLHSMTQADVELR